MPVELSIKLYVTRRHMEQNLEYLRWLEDRACHLSDREVVAKYIPQLRKCIERLTKSLSSLENHEFCC